jgi:pimeloyl-ACP methyl ester carboxylesterase
MKKSYLFLVVSIFLFSQFIPAQTPSTAAATPTPTPPPYKEKRPIIFIPGVLGSRLINSDTGENVWVKITRSKDDDLRLPMTPNLAANRDKLVATQVVDKIKLIKYFPQISVYHELFGFLDASGYKRGDWDNPHLDGALGDRDTYYLFAYDWRRDNVESAHRLLQEIEKLRAKLGKPDLKFDILAHSMGGLVIRYAAMYGKADIPENPKPAWDGSKYFNKIFLFGTPNDGSMQAFDAVNEGYSVPILGGKRHIGVLNKEVALSSPAAFELLPHGDALRFYDEDLKLMKIDIYDPAVWKTYKWSAAFDEQYLSTLSKINLLQVERYFIAVLNRAKKFNAALEAKSAPPAQMKFMTYGSDCKSTLDGAIIYREKDAIEWKTLTKGDSFRNSRGEKVPDDKVKQVIYAPGDGSVTKRSLLAQIFSLPGKLVGTLLPNSTDPYITCEAHANLLNNKVLQGEFLQEVLKD